MSVRDAWNESRKAWSVGQRQRPDPAIIGWVNALLFVLGHEKLVA